MTTLEPTRTAASRSVRSSELSKHPADVFAAVEQGPIEVTRRDGEPLVLMTKQEADLHDRTLRVAAQLIAVSLDDRGTLTDRLAVQFPWIRLFDIDEQDRCAREIIDSARGAFSVDRPLHFLTELHAWQSTAEAVAAGWDLEDVEWLDAGQVAEDPRSA